MAKYTTMPGRSRNSTIPQAIVEKRRSIFIPELEKPATKLFKQMETDQVDVQIEDPLVYSGIQRELQSMGYSIELKLDDAKPEKVQVEERKNCTFRVTRMKKAAPAIPPPLRKR